MASRLTDKQKKKIIADYSRLESYSATAKLNDVSHHTVKKIIDEMPEIAQKCQQKKDENTADILAYMDKQKDKVCEIIGTYLDALLNLENFDKITPNQLTTVIGTLIDKWAPSGGNTQNAVSPEVRAQVEDMLNDIGKNTAAKSGGAADNNAG